MRRKELLPLATRAYKAAPRRPLWWNRELMAMRKKSVMVLAPFFLLNWKNAHQQKALINKTPRYVNMYAGRNVLYCNLPNWYYHKPWVLINILILALVRINVPFHVTTGTLHYIFKLVHITCWSENERKNWLHAHHKRTASSPALTNTRSFSTNHRDKSTHIAIQWAQCSLFYNTPGESLSTAVRMSSDCRVQTVSS